MRRQFLHHRAPALAVLVTATLVPAACGSSESVATLDMAKVERAIAASSLAQRGQHAKVSCPAAMAQKEGLTFSCTAVVGNVSTEFVVEQDESGHVRYEAPGAPEVK